MLESRLFHLDNPKMTDPLSDVLSLLDAESLVSTGLKAGGGWSLRVDGHEGLKFNAVLSGTAWLAIDGRPDPIALAAGDCFLLARGLPFTMAADLAIPPVNATEVFSITQGAVATMGDGADFHVVGGRMTLDKASSAILVDALPDCIVLPAGSERASAMRWLLNRFAAEVEGTDAGHGASAAKLMHLMFIELIRAHLAVPDQRQQGWLHALADPKIGKALRLMHEAPVRPWTLKELAESTAMSRSSFAQRFRERVGMPPLDYLLRWRMRLARRDMLTRRESMTEVSRRYGYASESAFGNAFKRVFGHPPRRSVMEAAPHEERPRPG